MQTFGNFPLRSRGGRGGRGGGRRGATEVAIMGVGVLVEAEGVAMAGVVAQFGPPLLSYENQLLR